MKESETAAELRDLLPDELDAPDLSSAETPLAHSLSVRISWLNAALERQTNALLGEIAGLSMLEWRCLATLAIRGPQTGKDITRLCNINAPQASRGMRSLGQFGLIEWEAGSERRTFGPASLTPKGWATYRKVAPVMRARNRHLLAGLSETEAAELYRLIAHVRRAVAEEITAEKLMRSATPEAEETEGGINGNPGRQDK